jgi:hypothetical protein
MIATDWFHVVFRLIHIGAGVAWAGGVFLFVVFIQPSAAAIGPAAGPMMGQLLGVRKLVDRFLMMAGIAIVAGLVLYIDDVGDAASFGDFVGTGFGLGLTIGMVFALAAVSVGAFLTRPNLKRLLALQQAIGAAGGPPTPEQGQQVAAIQGQLKVYGRTALAFLTVAVAAMATARYW